MFDLIKKYLMLSIILTPTISYADNFYTFRDIKNYVVTGQPVHFHVKYSRCTPIRVDPTAFFIESVYTANTFSTSSNGNLLSTHSSITTDANGDPDELVLENVRYYIRQDNFVNVTIETFNPSTYKQRTSNSFDCHLSDGITVSS
ncbi:VirK family protein [Legionella sp. CNM-4043-24]|uniref:VirK family protein n=1 Tax=Legionella sp. CNM-4043-24 TaxID=3421646 RepID=UPI00403AF435